MQNRAMIYGYARVSTDEQTTAAQEMELRAAGCDTIVSEQNIIPAVHPAYRERLGDKASVRNKQTKK